MNIQQAIQKLVETIAQVVKSDGIRTSLPDDTYEVSYGPKWAKIVCREHYRDGRSELGPTYCFVCLEDHFTATLGYCAAGDIHKAASHSKPAKHARGNVFDPKYRQALTPYGIVYLK
jgi:hypothetical protein